jgi:hypothetical protein
LIGDVDTAFRVAQAIGALAMSLAAIPVYILAVRLGLSRRIGLAVAALALLVPDFLYASFITSEPFAYPLVMAAVAAATIALTEPTRRAQIAFIVFAALAALARAQLAVLPVVFVVAAVAIGLRERRVRAALREQLLPIAVFSLPVLAVVLAGPVHALGYYSAELHLHLHPIVFFRWSGWDLMVLAYASGWIVVPGALLGLWYGLRRPTSRLEQSFAVVVVLVALALVAEAGLLQANAAGRPGFGPNEVKERYLFYVVPLVGMCFALYARRGWPARLPHLALAAGLLVLSVRVPLSGFAIASTISASPILFGVYWLTGKLGGPGNAAAAIAAAVGLMSLIAVVASKRPRIGTPVALGFALLATGAASAGAVAFDVTNATATKRAYLPADPSFVDHSGLRHVALLQSWGGHRAPAQQQLFWNRSIDRLLLMPDARPIDSFRDGRVRVGENGSLLVQNRPLHSPLLVDGFGSFVQLRNASPVARGPISTLWKPHGAAQLSLYAPGVYYDGWLANVGGVYVWPERPGATLSGWISLRLTAPAELGALKLTFTLSKRHHVAVRLRPGSWKRVRLPVCARGSAHVTFSSSATAIAGLRVVGAKATPPVFTPGRAACPHG